MRLIDVDDAIEKINCLCVDGNENWIGTDNQSFVDNSEVIDILCDAPTVDAVPVVRCKDCLKRDTADCPMLDAFASYPFYDAKNDDFCSYGERRADEENQ